MIRLNHWGRVTHICAGKLTIIGSDNGLSPGRRQAIIWTNAGILLIRPLGTNFSEILIGIQTFSFKKMYLKMSSAKWRPFCLGLNVLTDSISRPQWVDKPSLVNLYCWHFKKKNIVKLKKIICHKIAGLRTGNALVPTTRYHWRWVAFTYHLSIWRRSKRTVRTRPELTVLYRVRFVYAPSQWETTLHCTVVSHWLGAFTNWSLVIRHESL